MKLKDTHKGLEVTIRDKVLGDYKLKPEAMTELELYNLRVKGIDLYYMFDFPKVIKYEAIDQPKANVKRKPKK